MSGAGERPSPLYRLLVLSALLSARISADIAIAAARELSAAGYRTPRAMSEASWQDRVDALGRGHYRRYDERTSTMLGDGAVLLRRRWRGDLRRLRQEAGGDASQAASLLTEFPGIGPAGADIFLREARLCGQNSGPTWTGESWLAQPGSACRIMQAGWPAWPGQRPGWPGWQPGWSAYRCGIAPQSRSGTPPPSQQPSEPAPVTPTATRALRKDAAWQSQPSRIFR